MYARDHLGFIARCRHTAILSLRRLVLSGSMRSIPSHNLCNNFRTFYSTTIDRSLRLSFQNSFKSRKTHTLSTYSDRFSTPINTLSRDFFRLSYTDSSQPILTNKPQTSLQNDRVPATPLTTRIGQWNHEIGQLIDKYLALSKARLSFLIVLSTTTAYSLYSVPVYMNTTAGTIPSLSGITLLFLTTGTALCSASANAMNMVYEHRTDALMLRTKNRPIVRGFISARSASLFALACGISGVSLLYYGTNGLVAGLGLLNIILYAGIYTPMKRFSVFNTWVGAVVGAIPPLMGWTAAAGECMPDSTVSSQHATHIYDWYTRCLSMMNSLLFSTEAIGGWILSGILFAWQFPHFNSLSYMNRYEYQRAGLRMLAWTNPLLNGRIAFLYTIMLFGMCGGLVYWNIIRESFFLISLPVNVWLVRSAWKFRQEISNESVNHTRYFTSVGMAGGRSRHGMIAARNLFWASVWYLPLVLIMAMMFKTGFIESVYARLAKFRESFTPGRQEDQDKDLSLMRIMMPTAEGRAASSNSNMNELNATNEIEPINKRYPNPQA